MPPASRVTDTEVCPGHGGGPIASGSPNTIIGHKPAGRVADTVACAGGPDVIARGASNVLINDRMAARIGDPTAHGATLATGDPTVLIGETPQSFALVGAAVSGKPFCEECERLRRERDAAAMRGTDAATDEDPAPIEAAPDDGASADPEVTASAAEADDPNATTQAERDVAAAPGDTPAQRIARESVVRSFYGRFADDGLGALRAVQDLGVGGVPPRANAHPLGFTIDLARPVRLVELSPEWDAATSVRAAGPAAGLLGNVFDPDVAPSPAPRPEPGMRRIVVTLPPGGGTALQVATGPTTTRPPDGGPPVTTPGGAWRWIVPSSVKESSTCVGCGSPRDVASGRVIGVGADRVAPRRCVCAGDA